MKYFVALTGIILLFYLLGFAKKTEKLSFMSRDFTIAIKGFAILTIVWAHSGACLGIGGIQFIAGVGVCLFLICSGYGLEMSYRKNGLKGFWKKRFLNVAIPFWTVELIGLLFTGTFALNSYLKDFFFIKAATAYGWFMQYIVICYTLYFLIKIMAGKQPVRRQMLLTIIAFMAWFVADSLFFANPDMPFLRARQMLTFPLGMFITEYKDMIEDKLKNKAFFILIGGGGLALYGNYTDGNY